MAEQPKFQVGDIVRLANKDAHTMAAPIGALAEVVEGEEWLDNRTLPVKWLDRALFDGHSQSDGGYYVSMFELVKHPNPIEAPDFDEKFHAYLCARNGL